MRKPSLREMLLFAHVLMARRYGKIRMNAEHFYFHLFALSISYSCFSVCISLVGNTSSHLLMFSPRRVLNQSHTWPLSLFSLHPGGREVVTYPIGKFRKNSSLLPFGRDLACSEQYSTLLWSSRRYVVGRQVSGGWGEVFSGSFLPGIWCLNLPNPISRPVWLIT